MHYSVWKLCKKRWNKTRCLFCAVFVLDNLYRMLESMWNVVFNCEFRNAAVQFYSDCTYKPDVCTICHVYTYYRYGVIVWWSRSFDDLEGAFLIIVKLTFHIAICPIILSCWCSWLDQCFSELQYQWPKLYIDGNETLNCFWYVTA